MTEDVGLLQRMATRLSLRKVKKEQGVKDVKDEEEKEEKEEEMKEESDVVKNGEQESVLHNDTKVGGKEPANELPTNGGKVTEKGKKKKAKDAKKEGDIGNESDMNEAEEGEGVMQRLKSRLSMRGKKKDKVTKTSDQQKECNGTNEDTKKEKKAEKKEKKEVVEEEPVVEEKRWVSGSKENDANKVEQEGEEREGKETEKKEKKKSDNAFIRMLRKLSFRKKKKKSNTENESGVEEGDKGGKELEKTLDEGNTGNNGDKLGEKRFEERETRPQSLVMSSGRPPPGPGRPPIHPRTTPSSATANVSRPVSDLDSALRQFKLSTAESRESLRTLGSRQDLTQVEERVREAVGKSLSRQGSLRRGASGSTSIPITLSVSLQELRANQ